MTHPDDPLPWLGALLSARAEDGGFRWAEREVEDFLAAMLLNLGVGSTPLTPELSALLARFARRAGVTPGASADETREVIEAHFRAHPLPPDLLTEFRMRFRDSVVALGSSELEGRLEQVLARAPRRLPTAERPEGTVPAGPLGLFLAKRKLDQR